MDAKALSYNKITSYDQVANTLVSPYLSIKVTSSEYMTQYINSLLLDFAYLDYLGKENNNYLSKFLDNLNNALGLCKNMNDYQSIINVINTAGGMGGIMSSYARPLLEVITKTIKKQQFILQFRDVINRYNDVVQNKSNDKDMLRYMKTVLKTMKTNINLYKDLDNKEMIINEIDGYINSLDQMILNIGDKPISISNK